MSYFYLYNHGGHHAMSYFIYITPQIEERNILYSAYSLYFERYHVALLR